MALSKPLIFGGGPAWEKIIKTLTFSNDTGALTLFTVTGDVRVSIIPICKTSVASAAAANVRLGVSTSTDAMIADTVATALLADEIWIDASPDSQIEAESTAREYVVSGGEDLILTLSAQVDSGVIAFSCSWRPESTDGLVIVA